MQKAKNPGTVTHIHDTLKNSKGITLIALVITIIILLILTVIVINITVGNNGLIGRVKEATILQNKARYFEELEIDIVSTHVEKQVNRKGDVFITVLEDEINKQHHSWIQTIITCNDDGNETVEPEYKTMIIVETIDGYEIVINVNNSKNEAYIDKEHYISLDDTRVTITYVVIDGETEYELGTQEVRNGFKATLGDCSYNKANYVFTGWSKYEDGKDEQQNESITVSGGKLKIDGNTKLYAQFSLESITISFNGNGASGTIVDMNVAKNVETNIEGKEEAYSREGYYFVGWSTVSGDNQTVEYTNTVTATENITLYAQWKQYITVTLDANSGKFLDETTIRTITRRQGEIVGELPTVTRDGYNLKGWYTSTTGGTEVTQETTATTTTIYAQWNVEIIETQVISDVSSWTKDSAIVNKTYTATKDCVVTGWIASYSSGGTPTNSTGIEILVNNISRGRIYTSSPEGSIQVPIQLDLKENDTFEIRYSTGYYKGFIEAKNISSPKLYIDTSSSGQNIWNVSSWTSSGGITYTATQDCVVTGWIANYCSNTPGNDQGVKIFINDVYISNFYTSTSTYSIQTPINIYLKQGDTIRLNRVSGYYKANVNVYPVVGDGKYVDTSKFITNISNILSYNTNNVDTTYTATEDCIVTGWIVISNATGSDKMTGMELRVDGALIGKIGAASSGWGIQHPVFIYLKNGETFSTKLLTGSYKGNLNVYGVK